MCEVGCNFLKVAYNESAGRLRWQASEISEKRVAFRRRQRMMSRVSETRLNAVKSNCDNSASFPNTSFTWLPRNNYMHAYIDSNIDGNCIEGREKN